MTLWRFWTCLNDTGKGCGRPRGLKGLIRGEAARKGNPSIPQHRAAVRLLGELLMAKKLATDGPYSEVRDHLEWKAMQDNGIERLRTSCRMDLDRCHSPVTGGVLQRGRDLAGQGVLLATASSTITSLEGLLPCWLKNRETRNSLNAKTRQVQVEHTSN